MIHGEHGIQCMPCSSLIISEMLPEIHTVEKFDLSQICDSFSNNFSVLYNKQELAQSVWAHLCVFCHFYKGKQFLLHWTMKPSK